MNASAWYEIMRRQYKRSLPDLSEREDTFYLSGIPITIVPDFDSPEPVEDPTGYPI